MARGTRPGALQPILTRLVEMDLIALTALQLLSIVLPGLRGPAEGLGSALLIAFVPLALLRARRPTRLVSASLAAAVAFLCLRSGQTAPILRGLRSALVFAAFLPLLQLLRAVASASPVVREVRDRFSALDPRVQRGAFAVGALGIGSVLSTGAHAVLAPLLPQEAGEDRRRDAALASIRGVSLAAFWSPFFLQVAFVTHHMPDVAGAPLLGLGLGIASIALATDLWITGAGARGLPAILRGLGPLAPPCAAMAAVLVGVGRVTGWSALQSMIVAIPVLGLGVLLVSDRRSAPAVLKAGLSGVARMSDEVLLISGACVFAATLGDTSAVIPAVAPALGGLPPAALLAITAAVILGLGAAGVHPSIPAAVIIGAFTGLPGSVNRLALAQTILVAWSLAAVISPVGITIMVAGQMFRVPHARLILSPNLRAALILAAASVAAMALLDRIAGHG